MLPEVTIPLQDLRPVRLCHQHGSATFQVRVFLSIQLRKQVEDVPFPHGDLVFLRHGGESPNPSVFRVLPTEILCSEHKDLQSCLRACTQYLRITLGPPSYPCDLAEYGG